MECVHVLSSYKLPPGPLSPCMDTTTDTAGTAGATTNTAQGRPRRLIRFVKNEPGHRVSVTVNILFLLNGLLFAVFGVMSLLMPSGTPDEHFDFMDIIGAFLFCMWNSIVFNMIILFPSITTINREKNLFFFYLNGFSVFFLRLSDFFRPLTRFQVFLSALMNICAYLLFMALFSGFYGMPDELHLVSRTMSMRPWKPVYEGDPEDIEMTSNASNQNVI